MGMNQNSSKSDENWVRYDQNHANHVKKPPLTQFWSYLTQFSPNLLDLWFIFMVICWKKLKTNDYNQYKLLLDQVCPRPVLTSLDQFFSVFCSQGPVFWGPGTLIDWSWSWSITLGPKKLDWTRPSNTSVGSWCDVTEPSGLQTFQA